MIKMYKSLEDFFVALCHVLQIVSVEAGNDGKGVVFRTKKAKSKSISLVSYLELSRIPPHPPTQRATSLVELL